MTAKRTPQHTAKTTTRRRKPQTVGESIIQGLKEAIAWTEGKNDKARDAGQRAASRRAQSPPEDGTQPVEIRDQVWLPTGHLAQLGTGQVAP